MVNTEIRFQRWKSSIQSAETRPAPDYGSDNVLLIAKFRPKLKTMGKTTRPFRYDLYLIPYSGSDEYIQEIRFGRQNT